MALLLAALFRRESPTDTDLAIRAGTARHGNSPSKTTSITALVPAYFSFRLIGIENTIRNSIYRAYRVPYDWIPQLDRPDEHPVVPPNLREFHIPAQ